MGHFLYPFIAKSLLGCLYMTEHKKNLKKKTHTHTQTHTQNQTNVFLLTNFRQNTKNKIGKKNGTLSPYSRFF